MPRFATVSATTDIDGMDRDLFEAQQNFATILHASPAIVCIIQLKSLRYCEINNSYERCTGYSRRDILGKASLNLGLWSNVEDRNKMFRKLLAQGRVPRHQEVFPLKTEDAAAVKEIDSVFVTVEPEGGAKKPSSQRLLYAYLGEANHP